MLKGAFTNGLRDIVRVKVRLHGLEDLNSTMKLDKKREENNYVMGREGSIGPFKKISQVRTYHLYELVEMGRVLDLVTRTIRELFVWVPMRTIPIQV